MSESYDVVIIGAGIIGAATALALGRAGRRALSLDKLPASGYGSTGGIVRAMEGDFKMLFTRMFRPSIRATRPRRKPGSA